MRGQEVEIDAPMGWTKSREVGEHGDAERQAKGGCGGAPVDRARRVCVPRRAGGRLYQWQYMRIGPPAYRVGRHIPYDAAAGAYMAEYPGRLWPITSSDALTGSGEHATATQTIVSTRHFSRKRDAEQWLASQEVAIARGEWVVDPALSKI